MVSPATRTVATTATMLLTAALWITPAAQAAPTTAAAPAASIPDLQVTVIDDDQPTPAPTDLAAYFFPYFTGEVANGEKVYFAASQGNNALAWDELNDGKPVLESTFGEQGVRDPFIIRSADGNKFFLLATDLKIYPNNSFATAQQSGSRHLEIWESEDLITWSNQRHVKVSTDYAGNTWAPEAYWDEASHQYVVYWASALYPTTNTAGRDIRTTYQKMMYVTTTDFVEFSEPTVWVDVSRGSGLGMIDSTVIKDGDYFYRFTKDERYMIPRLERSTSLLNTITGTLPTTTADPTSGWQLITEKVGHGLANQWGGTFTAGEGPTIVKANPGDTSAPQDDTWFLFIDQPSYHGGRGYVPFATHNLADPNGWYSVAADSDLPTSPRHGTVLPITQEEYERVLHAYQPDLLVDTIADQQVTTPQGTPATLPTTVAVTYADGTKRTQPVMWPQLPTNYADAPGEFVLRTVPIPGSSVRAELRILVTDADAPSITTLTTPSQPDGANDWYTTTPTVQVTATDDTGVQWIETSLNDGQWVRHTGDTAEVKLPDGRPTLRIRAADVFGTISTPVTLNATVDTEAPLSRAFVTTGERAVTIDARDAASGIDKVQYRVPGGQWKTYTEAVNVPDDARRLEYRAVDRAGNIEPTHTVTVAPATPVEKSVSTTRATLTPKKTTIGGKDVTVNVVVSSPGMVTGTAKIVVLRGSQQVATHLVDVHGGTGKAVINNDDLTKAGTYTVRTEYLGSATVLGSVAKAATLTVTARR
ncbi:OmpL47-type beta-barrel domain-containing protein [Jonesia quinghaiensis]|uniref:OmpL47-type beta-barrel domain-containing protein n=1 Tax=Jonesia quinghaiensis TaxID=262806 RepID=UPI00041E9854|nr:Ig-like domain-containing protein [Jonesia quinghaiensis]